MVLDELLETDFEAKRKSDAAFSAFDHNNDGFVTKEEMAELTGRRHSTLDDALRHLTAEIRAGDIDEEALVAYLARRAWRDEWLHQPVVELYPQRSWSAID